MAKTCEIKRLEVAAKFVRDGMDLTVGDLVLSSEDDATLRVTGWTRSATLENMTQKFALDELAEVIDIFNRMLEACPQLFELSGKSQVTFYLGYDYGMGGINICSSKNGVVHWCVDLKPQTAITKSTITDSPENEKKRKRGTKWMMFWIYGFLPAILFLFVCMQTATIVKLAPYKYKAFVYVFAMTICGACLIFGMHKRYLFAWWANALGIVAFFSTAIYKYLFASKEAGIIEQMTFIGLFTLVIIFNIVYWCNRKSLFNCTGYPRRKKAICLIFACSLLYIIFSFIRSVLQQSLT